MKNISQKVWKKYPLPIFVENIAVVIFFIAYLCFGFINKIIELRALIFI